MSLWTRLFRRREPTPARDAEPTVEAPNEPHLIALPAEPFVFECQSCGKVFEARRKRPLCPECDSPEVDLLSA